MRKPLAVANKILEFAQNSDGATVTPMQLIKLVYLSHGWMLGLCGKPLLNESVEAWRFGPVVRSVYNAVKDFRDKPVSYPIKPLIGAPYTDDFSQDELDIINQVYNIYGKWDGITLSNLTHQDGTPWDITWKHHGKNAVISNDLIENYYKQLYQTLQNQQAGQSAAG